MNLGIYSSQEMLMLGGEGVGIGRECQFRSEG